jgi:hypothetical protein
MFCEHIRTVPASIQVTYKMAQKLLQEYNHCGDPQQLIVHVPCLPTMMNPLQPIWTHRNKRELGSSNCSDVIQPCQVRLSVWALNPRDYFTFRYLKGILQEKIMTITVIMMMTNVSCVWTERQSSQTPFWGNQVPSKWCEELRLFRIWKKCVMLDNHCTTQQNGSFLLWGFVNMQP